MSLLNAKIGENAPESFNVVIEIPRGSTNKYEVDKDTGLIRLDRVLYSPLFYPFDYGYIPETHYLDGDPVDALVLITHPTFPGCIIEASPIGVLEMTDENGPDEKVMCVAVKDPRYGYRKSLDQLNEHTTKEITHFFEVYKQLENKFVEIKGWKDRETAMQIIRDFRV